MWYEIYYVFLLKIQIMNKDLLYITFTSQLLKKFFINFYIFGAYFSPKF